MKNLPVSNKPGPTSANYKKLTIGRSLMAGVIALALLMSLTWMRPLTNGKARAETGAKAESNLTGAQAVTKRLSVADAKAMSGGKMSDAEAEAFANFINAAADEDICWKNTNTRGVGTIPDRCPAGSTSEGLFCYKNCPAGYSTSPGGLICGKNCPAGWTETPLTCFIPPESRDQQFKPCPSGYEPTIFGTCFRVFPPDSMNKEWLPCPEGFEETVFHTCLRPLQSMNRDLVPRGEITARACAPGKQTQAGLCYDPCPPGTKGVGPVCWADCPSNFPENCGAACAKTRKDCALAVINMVISTGDMALNIAGLVSGAGAAKAAIQAGIRAASKHILTAAGRRTLLAKARNTLITQAKKSGKDIAEEILNKSSEALVGSYEKGQFDWTVLDPTGIAAVVEAFNKPMCR